MHTPILSVGTVVFSRNNPAPLERAQAMVAIGLLSIAPHDTGHEVWLGSYAIDPNPDFRTTAAGLIDWLRHHIPQDAMLMSWGFHDPLMIGIEQACVDADPADALALMEKLETCAQIGLIDLEESHSGVGQTNIDDLTGLHGFAHPVLCDDVLGGPVDALIDTLHDLAITRAVATWILWACDADIDEKVQRQVIDALDGWLNSRGSQTQEKEDQMT
jgi:hypothetical protein